MRRLLLALVVLFGFAGSASAQDQKIATFFQAYDVSATSLTYPLLTGNAASPFGGAIPGGAAVSTSGSSTTVTATTASTNPFASVGVGDELYFQTAPGTAVSVRYCTAKASSDSITIDTAITLTARQFTYKHFATGTAITSGAVDAATVGARAVQLCVQTLNATSITFSIEGRLAGAPAWATLVAPPFSATGCEIIAVPEALDQLRVGVKVNTDTGVQSVSAIMQSTR